MARTGILAGPIRGLRYETPSHHGLTNERGEFDYEDAERVAFLLGATTIGNVTAAPRIHLAQIVARVDGDLSKLKDAGITNIARLIFTLGRSAVRDDGTEIPSQVHELIGVRPLNFRHDADYAATTVTDKVQEFTDDAVIVALLADIDASGIYDRPRELVTAANAHNELRRNAMGILRSRDVQIPLANGSHVFADIFRPAEPGQYPVIMNCGPYGKAFNHHSIDSDEQLEKHELMEDAYFSGNPDGLQFENHESVNTAAWVPDGYIVIRVDMPGAGKSPGQLRPWGIAGAEAFRDAIDWAGEQPWSNGNVGTWGMSYLAISQHAAASLHPRHLKAMIAIGTDVDLYEEVAYSGGILNAQFWPIWRVSGLIPPIVGTPDVADFIQIMKDSPFRDSDPDRIFGPRAEVFMSPDMAGVDIPLWAVASTTHISHLHQLGGSNAYLSTPTTNKKLDFWEDWFQKSYAAESRGHHKAFFDHWLKGLENGIMDTPPVRLEIRSGDGASFMQEEQEWPVARTNYTRWYLDANASDWAGDGRRPDYLRLSTAEPTTEAAISYSAEVQLAPAAPVGSPRIDPNSASSNPSVTGLSFVSEPLTGDAVIAGYGKIGMWVSSSSTDMDVFASVRAIGSDDSEVDFTGFTTMAFPDRPTPLMKGWLKVSHRMLDPERSTEYSPKHTHRKADYAPLVPDELVQVEIELIPNTGMVRAGQRLRVDIQPYDGVAHGTHHSYDASFHDGATNAVHTGPAHLGYVQLPIVPTRPGSNSQVED